MRKQILCWLIITAITVIYVSCASGSKNGVETKDKIMTFNLENCAYPVEFANYQRNSYVPAEVRRKYDVAWSKRFDEIDPELLISPRAVLVKDTIVAVKAASELILYDTSGRYMFMEAIGNPSPVVLGAGGMAYFNESDGLVYQDYDQKKLRDEEPVPGFDEWAYALLIRPIDDEVLGVVQNAGIRGQSEKKHYIYRFLRDDLSFRWTYEFPGTIDHALLTSDEKALVAIVGDAVTLYNTENGEIVFEFQTGLVRPFTASLNLDGELVLIGTAEDKQGARKYCKAYSLEGEELWSIDLVAPILTQPPVSGEDSRVYLVDNGCLKCISGGEILWSTPPAFGNDACVTLTGGNYALVLDHALLSLYDPAGERIHECLITREGVTFGIPPAVDDSGKIFVLSDKNLYGIE